MQKISKVGIGVMHGLRGRIAHDGGAFSVKYMKLSASFLLQRTLPINKMRALGLCPNGLGFQEFAADRGVR